MRRASILCLLLLVAGCDSKPGATNQPWNQLFGRGDNTSLAILGPMTIHSLEPLRLVVGDPGTSTPVETPDGGILVAVYAGSEGKDSKLVKIMPNEGRPVRTFAALSGQISTPTVDSQGNVYVVVNKFGYPAPPGIVELKSLALKFDSQGNEVWRVGFHSRPFNNSPPKILEDSEKTTVFVPVRGTANSVSEILVIDALENHRSVMSCAQTVSSGVDARPVQNGILPPYPEGPGLTLIRRNPGDAPWLVDSVEDCAVVLFQIASSTLYPSDWPPKMMYPSREKVISESPGGTASFDAFSQRLLVPVGHHLNQYDLSANKLGDIEMDRDIANLAPPTGANSAILVTASFVTLTGIDPPTVGPTRPHTWVSRPRSVVFTPTRIYVSGADGVHAFDTHLALKSFYPIADSDGSTLAITSSGTLVAAARNGMLHFFPAN